MGLAGETGTAHWQADYAAAVLTTAAYGAIRERDAQRQVTRWLRSVRQVVENGKAGVTDVLHWPWLQART